MKKIIVSIVFMISFGLSMIVPTYASTYENWVYKDGKYYYDNTGGGAGTFNAQITGDLRIELPVGWTSIRLLEVDGTFIMDMEYLANPAFDNTMDIQDYDSYFEIYFDGTVAGTERQFSKNKSYKIEVTAPHVDNHKPVLQGQQVHFVTSIDDPNPVSYFQGFLKAIDETDGDITSRIYVVSDDYTANTNQLGIYKIVFGVKDLSNNESQLETFVTILDNTKPVITGNTATVQISYTKTYDVQAFRATLTATDNYDTIPNSAITILSDNYTSNKTKLGTYTVVFEAKDTSNNSITFTKNIEVIDDIAPVFNGSTTITKNSNTILTLNQIKGQLTATDFIEGNKTDQIRVIEDNFTGNGNKVGSYTVTFEVADSKGNKATRVVTVTVSDKLGPVWFIQDGVSINLVPPASITREQLIDLLIATNQIKITAQTTFNFTLDEYVGNENIPGVYSMVLELQDTAGNEQLHAFSVVVLETEEDQEVIVVDEAKDLIETVTVWIKENKLTAGLILVGAFLLIGGLVVVVNSNQTVSKKSKYDRFRR